MILKVHNPARPRVATKKQEKHVMAKKKRAKAKRKKKTTTKRTAPRRSNPAPKRKKKTVRASSRRRSNPSRPRKSSKRRRRNPETTGSAVKSIAKALGVAVAASAVTIVGATFAGEHAKKVYGGAALAGIVGGALLAKSHPNAGLGLALGAAGVSLFPLIGGTVAGQLAAANVQPDADQRIAGMGAVTYDRMGAVVRNVSASELGYGPAAGVVSNVPIRQLGMGAVTYDRMGDVTYDRMGAVSVDRLVRQGNPFSG